MSAEPRIRPSIGRIFHRFAATLPAHYSCDTPDGPASDYSSIPAYKGVRIHDRALGLAVSDVAVIGTPEEVSGCVILATLDRELVGTCTVDLITACVTWHAQPGECEAGPLMFSLDHATAVVTEASGEITDVFELRRWLLRALEATPSHQTPLAGAHA